MHRSRKRARRLPSYLSDYEGFPESNVEKRQRESETHVCRACLASGEGFWDMFLEECADTFTECTSVEVERDDHLPHTICDPCKELLLKLYYFKQQCLESDAKLKQTPVDPQDFGNWTTFITVPIEGPCSNIANKNDLVYDANNIYILKTLENIKIENEYNDLSDDIDNFLYINREHNYCNSGIFSSDDTLKQFESIQTNEYFDKNMQGIVLEDEYNTFECETSELIDLDENIKDIACDIYIKTNDTSESEIESHIEIKIEMNLDDDVTLQNVDKSNNDFSFMNTIDTIKNEIDLNLIKIEDESLDGDVSTHFNDMHFKAEAVFEDPKPEESMEDVRSDSIGKIDSVRSSNTLFSYAQYNNEKYSNVHQDSEENIPTFVYNIENDNSNIEQIPDDPNMTVIGYDDAKLEHVVSEDNKISLEKSVLKQTTVDDTGDVVPRYLCLICKKKFFSEKVILLHIKKHRTKSKEFRCNFCKKTYKKHNNFLKHNCSVRIFHCPYCENTYNLKNSYLKHLLRHNKNQNYKPSINYVFKGSKYLNKSYQCDICKIFVRTKLAIAMHMREHKELWDLQCSHCVKYFRTKELVRKHKNRHHQIYDCKDCKASFNKKGSLKKHVENKHSSTEKIICSDLVYQCSWCSNKYSLKSTLDWHVKSQHTLCEFFVCDVCYKKFNTKETLEKHAESHKEPLMVKCDDCADLDVEHFLLKSDFNDKNRRYNCVQCVKKFKNRTCLNNHLKYASHNNESSKIKCEFCTETFDSRFARRKHTFSVHKNLQYNCPHCPKSFVFTGEYEAHVLTHTDPHLKCDYCDKMYRSEVTLRIHVSAVHRMKGNYQCAHCPEKFELENELTEHMSTHTIKYNIKCPVCKKIFKTRHSLWRHMKNVHMLSHKKIINMSLEMSDEEDFIKSSSENVQETNISEITDDVSLNNASSISDNRKLFVKLERLQVESNVSTTEECVDSYELDEDSDEFTLFEVTDEGIIVKDKEDISIAHNIINSVVMASYREKLQTEVSNLPETHDSSDLNKNDEEEEMNLPIKSPETEIEECEKSPISSPNRLDETVSNEEIKENILPVKTVDTSNNQAENLNDNLNECNSSEKSDFEEEELIKEMEKCLLELLPNENVLQERLDKKE